MCPNLSTLPFYMSIVNDWSMSDCFQVIESTSRWDFECMSDGIMCVMHVEFLQHLPFNRVKCAWQEYCQGFLNRSLQRPHLPTATNAFWDPETFRISIWYQLSEEASCLFCFSFFLSRWTDTIWSMSKQDLDRQHVERYVVVVDGSRSVNAEGYFSFAKRSRISLWRLIGLRR
jgi:hypothetical protein